MITLRALEPEDLDALYAVENDSDAVSVTSNVTPLSHYALKQYIATQQCDIFADGQLRLAVVDNEHPDTVLGIVDLADFSFVHSRAEVGVYVLPPYRRRSIATEALQQLIDYAFGRLKIRELHAYVAEDNTASLALFRKTGFEATSRLKSWFSCDYGICEEDAREKDAIIFQIFSKKESNCLVD